MGVSDKMLSQTLKQLVADGFVRRIVTDDQPVRVRYELTAAGREVAVAILVCDIRQFTPFADAHLSFDVVHVLNRFFGHLGWLSRGRVDHLGHPHVRMRWPIGLIAGQAAAKPKAGSRSGKA